MLEDGSPPKNRKERRELLRKKGLLSANPIPKSFPETHCLTPVGMGPIVSSGDETYTLPVAGTPQEKRAQVRISRNGWQRLLDFVEQPIFLAVAGIVGSILGVLLAIPVFIICDLCLLLALHRSKAVADKGLRIQLFTYLGLFVTAGVGLVFFGMMVRESARSYTQEIASAVVSAFAGTPRKDQPFVIRSVDEGRNLAVEEAKAINEFLGGKDELHLQELFAVSEMIKRNIVLARDRIIFSRNHSPGEDLDINPYIDNDEYQIDLRFGRVIKHGGTIRFEQFPNEVGIITIPKRYSTNKAIVVRFIHSGTLPANILEPLKEFNSTLEADTKSLFDALNEALKEKPDYFLDEYDSHSPTWQTVNGKYRARFILLEPKADAVTKAVREFLKI
jgi:hypothetical protein